MTTTVVRSVPSLNEQGALVWTREPRPISVVHVAHGRACPGCGRLTHPGELLSVSPEDWRCLYCLEGR